jgi:kumamolisin
VYLPRDVNRTGPTEGGVGVASAAEGPARHIANTPPYLVPEILKAYGADDLGVTGAGQTIAILIDTFPDDDDLREFWRRNRLPVSLNQIEKVNVQGGSLPPQEGEETLDAEWSSGIAPGATIRIYASGSLNFVDLDQALDRIIADLKNQKGMHQLSISLGLGETFMAEDEVATQRQKLLRLASAGVNVFVSSGDAGSNPDETGHGSDGPLQPEFEASDPFVVAVGGTFLTLDPGTGLVASETGWNGSGGGRSTLFDRPSWQKGPGVPTGNQRLVPDVSLAAAPEGGAFLFFQGQGQPIGGTSWSAPVWAGFCALMNEARAKAGQGPLPFLNTRIYRLAEGNSQCFRDITAGSNGAFEAGPGYDLVTGIGAPNVKALTRALTSKSEGEASRDGNRPAGGSGGK